MFGNLSIIIPTIRMEGRFRHFTPLLVLFEWNEILVTFAQFLSWHGLMAKITVYDGLITRTVANVSINHQEFHANSILVQRMCFIAAIHPYRGHSRPVSVQVSTTQTFLPDRQTRQYLRGQYLDVQAFIDPTNQLITMRQENLVLF